MQPPDIMGGEGRSENAWSCYDPDRMSKVDYAGIPMPSQAMMKTITKDLLATQDPEGNFY